MSDTKNPLSKASLQSEGIEIKLTQNDVIDALVEQQIENFINNFEELKKDYKNIFEVMTKEFDDFKESKINLLKIPKGASVKRTSYRILDYKEKDVLRPIEISRDNYARDHGKLKFYFNHHPHGERAIVVDCKVIICCILSIEMDEIIFSGETTTKSLTFKHSKELAKMVEDYNEKCKAFESEFPKEGISEKELAKRIKNQFTKQMLTAVSSDLKKALDNQFKLGLGK